MLREVFLSFSLLLLFSCAGDGRVRLVVYSPHGKEMLADFERRFEDAEPGIDLQWLDMGSQDVYDRVRTEKANPQADLWWGAPSLMFARAEEESLLHRFIPSWDSAVSSEMKSGDHFWYGTFITPQVIMYNSRLLSEQEAPADWDELLRPEWKEKIIIRYPLASGTMRIIFSSLIQREAALSGRGPDAGFEWLLALDANTKTYTADPTQLYLKIAREEGVVTLWNLPDVVIQREQNGYPFGYTFPASGTPMIVDAIAVIRGTARPDEAVRFVEFVTSEENLRIQAEEYYRIPARTDVPRPAWLGDAAIKRMEVDWKELALREKEWMKRWDESVKGRGRK